MTLLILNPQASVARLLCDNFFKALQLYFPSLWFKSNNICNCGWTERKSLFMVITYGSCVCSGTKICATKARCLDVLCAEPHPGCAQLRHDPLEIDCSLSCWRTFTGTQWSYLRWSNELFQLTNSWVSPTNNHKKKKTVRTIMSEQTDHLCIFFLLALTMMSPFLLQTPGCYKNVVAGCAHLVYVELLKVLSSDSEAVLRQGQAWSSCSSPCLYSGAQSGRRQCEDWGWCQCRRMFSMTVSNAAALPRLLFCNFTAQGLLTWRE